MRLLSLTALLTLAAVAPAQQPAQQPDFGSFDRRLTDLERRVVALERNAGTTSAALAAAPQADGRRTYADAYRQALAADLPLVVWSGSAVCPPCVAATEGEWVNYVGSVPGYDGADALVAYVPEGGVLRRAGTITEWVVGDAVRGHVPSLRRAIRRWRESRQVTDTPAVAAYQPAAVAAPMMAGYGMGMTQPVMMAGMGYGGPMMTGGGGGCASCGSSGRAGLFRR